MSTVLSRKNPSEIRLPLVEKFYSLQGEGYNAGHAAFFVRFSGCNLNCRFADGAMCDTPWQKPQEKITLEELGLWLTSTVEDAVTRGVRRGDLEDEDLSEAEPPLVILTGGEPTMNPNFDAVVDYLHYLDFPVAVETNGTVWKDALESIEWVVVSPKDFIAQEGALASPEPDPRVLSVADEFRYVISDRDAVVPPYLTNLRDPLHYLSPAFMADGTGMEWKDPGYVPQFVPGAVDRCIEIIQADPRWLLSIQSHKFLRVR